MKRTMFILSRIIIAGILLLTSVESTTITSVSYNAGTNILTFTFSDSVYTDNILLGRMTFDDDNGGPNPDVVFSGGTLLTAEPLSPELQISLIYGGIIDHWKSPDGKERDIWGNALTLVNAVESLDMSSLRLIIEEGTFINNIAEPFDDTDGNGVYSPAEQFTDLNGDSLWTPAEPFTDADSNGVYSPAEQYADCGIEADTLICETDDDWNDSFGNGEWDGPEEFIDCGLNNNNIYICETDDNWDDSFGNVEWDGIESFEDGSVPFPEDGVWNFNDNNGNGICNNIGPPPLWECEPFVDLNANGLCDQEFDADGDGIWFPGDMLTDLNGNNTWDGAEEFTDLNGDSLWTPAEPLVDFDGDNQFDEVSEEFTDTNGNEVWDQYEPNALTSINITVSGQGVYPVLSSAYYDANINKLTLMFDRPVQFDQIPEDETFLGGPGDGNLNSGEDRNGNGVLDKETNVNIFKVGFTDNIGSTKTLEGLSSLVQTADSETMEILLTRNDSKSLETLLDISSMSVNLSEGAFMDTLYNPSAMSTLPITTTLDSLPLLADSAVYNISENTLLIFFRSKETNKRIVVTNPAPIYSKISLSIGDSSMNLSGINGTPFVHQSEIFLRIKQLMLKDQKELEMLIDGMDTESDLYLTIDEYAIYDENNNGNLEVIDIPVTIIDSDDIDNQPPQIVSSGIVYDADKDILKLPWNMGVGFFNEVHIPDSSGASSSDLEGISLFDSSEDSLIMFSQGEVYFPSSNDTTFIKLSEADAELLENYPNRSSLTLIVEPFTFYSAGTYNNGNKVVAEDSLFVVDYQFDTTAPVVNEVLFNVLDSTLSITLDELVDASLLYPTMFTFGGVEINGSINVADNVEFVSSFYVSVSGDVYDEIISLNLTNPNFEAVADAFVNIDGTTSDPIDMNAAYGRYFWTKSFEAFAPAPKSHFAALRASGNYCDIYVDTELWNSKVNAEDLGQIMTAFESSAPGDSTTGIAGLTQEFLGADIKDTDGNSKVIFVLTDILDEYGLGRNDTKSSLFVHGYSTVLDTVENEPYSNSGDIIYLDADPMSLTSNDEDLSATYNAISHEYSRMIMQHNQPDQENWIIEGVSTILQKKTTGDVKFFGRSTSPSFTAGNQLTYIATGYQSLKGRSDKYNAYLFLSYLQEKYSADGTGWDIIQAIAQSDSIGIKAVGDALVTMEIDTDVKDIFANYGMACYLDAAHVENLYNGNYNFEGFNLQTPPSGKSAALLSWNASIGKGAPYTKKDILPWSYNYLIMQGYSFDLAGNVNYLSPDLNADDELVFNGYDGISFKVKKLILKSSFLNQMNPDYEVVDIFLNDNTGYGTLPVTTKDGFALKDTLDYAVDGVQLMVLMIAKTDDAQPPATYDFAVSNVVSLPDFSDLYAYQNPGIQNYLDVYVVSQRRVFDHLGNEGPVVNYSIIPGDSGSVALTELTSYGSDLVIYHTSKALSNEGTYQFIYQGNDQSGNLFEVDSLTIVVDYYDPASASRIVAGSAEFNLQSESLENPLMIAAGTIPLDCTVSFPEGFAPVSEIMMFGPDDQKLKRSANVTFFFNETDQTMSIYQLHQGEWRHIGAEILENSLQARSNSLGQFVVLAGNHGELDKELVLPEQYTLHQNYPNPFNPVTHITFDIPDQGHVSLVIYDIMGREISRIFDGNLKSGQYTFIWKGEYRSGSKQGAGIYFYRLTTDDFQQTRKMLILK